VIVTAALCWWNEDPALLRDCIRGIAHVADRVVALDGAYARYPGATVRSSDNEVRAIRETAHECGLGALVLQPDRLWAGQLEKRTYLLNVAAIGSDWIVYVDSDHIITAERACIRDELSRTSVDVLDVPMDTPPNPGRGVDDCAPSRWHVEQTEGRMWHPLIFRAFPAIRLEDHHWWISAEVAGVRSWLWPGERPYQIRPRERVKCAYSIEHRCMFRSVEQVRAERAFENDRETVVLRAQAHEDNSPSLPVPVWDFERFPA
jgi:hypothetical protein